MMLWWTQSAAMSDQSAVSDDLRNGQRQAGLIGGRPVEPASILRTWTKHALGGAGIVPGFLALLVGAPLVLMMVMMVSGAFDGAIRALWVAGLGFLMFAANCVVLGLAGRSTGRGQDTCERDAARAAGVSAARRG